MKRRRDAVMCAMCSLPVVLSTVARAESEDARAVLRMMPADAAVSAVVVNFELFNESLVSLQKRVDPDATSAGPLEEFKGDLGIGEWVDFSKPVGIGGNTFGDGKDAVLWLDVPEFTTKVKSVSGAVEEGGVWRLVNDEAEELYVKPLGEYVVTARSKSALESATKGGRSLADELQPRAELFGGRDAYVHVNIDPLRNTWLAGLAQMAQMSPMFALAITQQGGNADPVTMAAVFEKLFEATKGFLEQLAYIDMAIRISDSDADITLATGYRAGPIKDYLAKQQPAKVRPFSHIDNEPYAMAMSYHFPGTESPFYEYVTEQMRDVVKKRSAPATSDQPAAPAPPTAEDEASAEEVIQLLARLYHKIEGAEAILTATPTGVTIRGGYIGSDTTGIMELLKRVLTAEYPLIARLKGWAKVDALGAKKVGNVNVEQFAMKLDPANPSGAVMASIYGDQMRFDMGVAGGRVLFCVGCENDTERFFSRKVRTPFASSPYTADALAKLPAKRSTVALIDPARLISLSMRNMGRQLSEPIPPGPPIAMSASFVGEPVRLDIHVPLRAIDRVMKAIAPLVAARPATSGPVDPMP